MPVTSKICHVFPNFDSPKLPYLKKTPWALQVTSKLVKNLIQPTLLHSLCFNSNKCSQHPSVSSYFPETSHDSIERPYAQDATGHPHSPRTACLHKSLEKPAFFPTLTLHKPLP